MKTKYESYLFGKLSEGCKFCLEGKKGVLFITGLCSRNCQYCPLSNKRKSKDKIWFNEREINSFKDLIEEIKSSNAKSCGITGGDPLINLNRTLKFARFLKQRYGMKFHIHIYLSTKLVNKNNLSKLSKFIDEVRFHPDLSKDYEEEIKKISLADKFWDKKNIGIELPCFSDKKKEILEFILKASPCISFVNLNELELGESNERFIFKRYALNKEGYTVKDSIKSGLWILKKIKVKKLKLNVHLCTAKTKNWYQYRNRLKNYSFFPFAKKTEEGTLIYFFTDDKMALNLLRTKDYFFYSFKKRIVLNPKVILKLKGKLKIYKCEEYPSFDKEEILIEEIK